jgi:hypothetical protein
LFGEKWPPFNAYINTQVTRFIGHM